MNLPGFSAESSLYRTRGHYYTVGVCNRMVDTVQPQGCDPNRLRGCLDDCGNPEIDNPHIAAQCRFRCYTAFGHCFPPPPPPPPPPNCGPFFCPPGFECCGGRGCCRPGEHCDCGNMGCCPDGTHCCGGRGCCPDGTHCRHIGNIFFCSIF